MFFDSKGKREGKIVPSFFGLRNSWKMYRISENCDGCGQCAACCPLDIIVQDGAVYKVGFGCNSCGSCSVVCPRGAIKKS